MSHTAVGTTAVVLCGGAGRRFGSDKTRALLSGRPLLDHVLDGLPADWAVVCVGPERPTERPVRWAREEPAQGGPVAALAAALPLVHTPVVVLLGGDMPYAGPAVTPLAAELVSQTGGSKATVDAVVARDGDGRVQPLLAAYLTDSLRRTVPEATQGVALMRVLDALRTRTVPVEAPGSLDVDTPDDLVRARGARPRLAP
jgi:molybdopterin-guanine dinucleotide biosynthesis protein A